MALKQTKLKHTKFYFKEDNITIAKTGLAIGESFFKLSFADYIILSKKLTKHLAKFTKDVEMKQLLNSVLSILEEGFPLYNIQEPIVTHDPPGKDIIYNILDVVNDKLQVVSSNIIGAPQEIDYNRTIALLGRLLSRASEMIKDTYVIAYICNAATTLHLTYKNKSEYEPYSLFILDDNLPKEKNMNAMK